MGQGGPAPAPSRIGLELIAAIKAMRRVAFTYTGDGALRSRNVSA